MPLRGLRTVSGRNHHEMQFVKILVTNQEKICGKVHVW